MFHEYQIYTASITNPCLVLNVHMHKMYQNTLATSAFRAEMARVGKDLTYPQNLRLTTKNLGEDGFGSLKDYLSSE